MTQPNVPENSNVVMEAAQPAEIVAPTVPEKSTFSFPMAMILLAVIGFTCAHIYKNRDEYISAITGEQSPQKQCASQKSSCCQSQAEGSSGCPFSGCQSQDIMATLKSQTECTDETCPLSNLDKAIKTHESGCCDKMQNALTQALIEAHNNHMKNDNQNTQVSNYLKIPSPSLPE